MQLTYTQKQQLYTQGYVKVPGVVPQVMVDAIDHDQHGHETMADIGREWEGMREVASG